MDSDGSIKYQFVEKFISPWLDPFVSYMGQFYIAPFTVVGLPLFVLIVCAMWNWRKAKAKNSRYVAFAFGLVVVGLGVIYYQVQFIQQRLAGN